MIRGEMLENYKKMMETVEKESKENDYSRTKRAKKNIRSIRCEDVAIDLKSGF